MDGGVQIKLKLGKGDTPSSPDNTAVSTENKVPETSAPKKEEAPVKKENVDEIRKVIKFDKEEPQPMKKEEKPIIETKKKEEPVKKEKKEDIKLGAIASMLDTSSAGGSKEDLESKRAILQNLKDFDFQIKKNQEDINKLSEKLDSLSKDLDDLVSLYEIVSEQMNPFVGLSKVTKKRLDALETFTKEMDTLKTRIGDIESVLEKNSMALSNIKEKAQQVTQTMTIDHGFSDTDIDKILEISLESVLTDQKLDEMINDFISQVQTKR